jgi:hypothetical protein
MKASDVLFKACDLISERGWAKGGYVGPEGCLCADGAILMAEGLLTVDDDGSITLDQLTDSPVEDLVKHYLYDLKVYRRSGDWTGNIVNWNDQVAESEKEVLAVLHYIADCEKAKGN